MITLVTDSTAYLTKEEADRLKLRVVPMHYTIAGNSYTEGFADENQNFVDKIAANPDLWRNRTGLGCGFCRNVSGDCPSGRRGALCGDFLAVERCI